MIPYLKVMFEEEGVRNEGREGVNLFTKLGRGVSWQMELQSSDNSDLILGIALRKLAVNFAKFKPRDFTYWFQSAFQNVLHAVNRSQMVTLPLRISCDSYQQMWVFLPCITAVSLLLKKNTFAPLLWQANAVTGHWKMQSHKWSRRQADIIQSDVLNWLGGSLRNLSICPIFRGIHPLKVYISLIGFTKHANLIIKLNYFPGLL